VETDEVQNDGDAVSHLLENRFTKGKNIVSSIFTGEEEMFAWDRTVSRLTEMQTAQYWMERDRQEEADYL